MKSLLVEAAVSLVGCAAPYQDEGEFSPLEDTFKLLAVKGSDIIPMFPGFVFAGDSHPEGRWVGREGARHP